MTTHSCLYVGSVMHRRFHPRPHWFRYRAFWILVDLTEVKQLSQRLRLFSLDRFNIFGLHNSDHGDGSATPVLSQVMRHLTAAGIDLENGSVRLLCMPRVLGYVFNPLSIFFCYRSDGKLAATIHEVHNTFGERHIYLMPVHADSPTIHQRCDKDFYVSPFLDLSMRYDFSIRVPAERIAVAIRALQADQQVMTACLSGDRKPLTDRWLMGVFLAVPFLTVKVIAAIHWQALRLWLKGLHVRYRAPRPLTVGALPAALERMD